MAADFFSPLPVDQGAFDRRKAAHLLRRASFAPHEGNLNAAVEQGLEATVDQLLADNAEQEAAFQQTFDATAGSLLNVADPSQVQAWWIHRMVHTRSPLREKLTLFWHGHFATSVHKVEGGTLMLRQIDTLRGLAWGSFRELVLAMARDPAMLVWLDGESSTREHPNENFARELMELFTCGIGHYQEQDVRAAARAFTGWHREGAEFAFHADDHDFDRKEFLGKSGRFDGGDVIDILMQQPATPRFIAGKLLRFFACPQPSEEAVDAAGRLLDQTQLDIKWFLRSLFLSAYFYSDECYRRRIASPVEFGVGTVRCLGARLPAQELNDHIQAMGQELLAPPNVKGWEGERAWINSSTWPARRAFAETIGGLFSENAFGPHLPLDQIVPPELDDARDVIDRLAEVLLQGDLAAAIRDQVVEFLTNTDEGPNADAFRNDEDFRFTKTRQALALMLSLPEYQCW
ncbi:MAG TPA: DUF1800 domain-containing protein [Pirellulales bacterium]|nr:DUF1800 domain-containing protein [Pirellulales bacterium]